MAADQITAALLAIRQGRREAIGDLLSLVYGHLRAMARRCLAGAPGYDLDSTALVHETYLKLFEEPRLVWNDRRHFFSVAALAMRQIVVDEARRRRSQKRGGGAQRIDLDSASVAMDDQTTRNLAVHEALLHLGQCDERLARVVEMRFFRGLKVREIAEALHVTERTINRDWRTARNQLYRELAQDPQGNRTTRRVRERPSARSPAH